MPTYDYQCRKCLNVHERFVSYEDRDKPCACPDCRGALSRVWLTAPSVKGDDCDWSNENNGRGRLNPQTRMYHKNVQSVIDEGKRRGWEASRG